jgi:cytochrome c-type biogenesis protein CcmF
VLHGDRLAAALAPERRSFPVGRTTTTEAAIHTTWLSDLYAVLGDERDGAAVLRLHHNPLAPWIWIGAAIMALGGALSLSDRRVRVSAPAPRAARVGEARA